MERSIGRHRWKDRARRAWVIGATAVMVPLAVLSGIVAYRVVVTDPRVWFGIDLEIIRELGRRWLEAGTMYLPYQLAGPYSIDVTPENLATTPALYPPAAGPVFAAVHLVPWPLAVVLWWTVPLAITVYAIVRWQPARWCWPLMVACFVHPSTWAQLMVGGTSMWAMGLTAAGLLVGWPAAVILLKPTLLPFALVGIRHRSWWVAAGGIAVLTILGPWREYLLVVANAAESANGVLYSLGTFPLVMLPVIARLAARNPRYSRL